MKPSLVDVSVITVGTDERDFIEKCLRSLRATRTRFKLEVIVVDNGSTDGTAEMVRRDFPNAKLIVNARKLGYIENNRAAMKEAAGRYFLLLNSDMELRPETLEHTVDFMEKTPDAGVCACKLLFGDETLQLTCRRFPTPLTYLARVPHALRWIKFLKPFAKNQVVSRYLMLDYDHLTARSVDWLVSAFFLLRRSAVEDVGPVGEHLLQPFYLEDVDWCFRARLKGWKTYYLPEVTAYHHYQRGSVMRINRLTLVHVCNIAIFFAKNGWSMLLQKHADAVAKAR